MIHAQQESMMMYEALCQSAVDLRIRKENEFND